MLYFFSTACFTVLSLFKKYSTSVLSFVASLC
jgi:hypothetical protein